MRITFLGNGIIWNGSRKNIIRFVDGKYSTEDKKEIERLKDYPTDPPNAIEDLDKPKEVKDYTIKELKIYAKENDIDLKGAKNKVDILAVIQITIGD